MKPLALDLRGVGRFPELHIAFTDGAVAVTGPNGAGKSTLLNAIEFALFADGSRDLAGLLGPWADRLEILLTFEHDHELYRVRRGYRLSTGGRGSATLDLETFPGEEPDGSWLPLTREDTKATQALLERTLGLTRRTFRASSFLAQGDGAAFTEATPADRKAVLGEILDPRSLWAGLAKAANERAKRLDQELAADRGRAETLGDTIAAGAQIESDLTLARDEHTIADLAVHAADQALEQTQAAEAANQAAAERVRAAAAERDTAQAVVGQAREKADHAQTEAAKLPAAREKLTELEKVAARIPELEVRVREQGEAIATINTARARRAEAVEAAERQRSLVASRLAARTSTISRRDTLASRLAHLQNAEAGGERCDRCEQILGAQAKAAAATSMAGELAQIDSDLTESLADIDAAQTLLEELDETVAGIEIPAVPEGDFQTPLTEARTAAERVATGKVVIEGLEQAAAQADGLLAQLRAANATLAEKEEALAAVSAGVKDTAALAADVSLARQIVTTRRRALDEAAAQVTRLEERAKTIEAAKDDLRVLAAVMAARQTALDVARLAEKAFGRDGIPALLVENAVPQIETEANRILEAMPTTDGVVMQLELQTQREQKTVDNLKETLDVIVADPDGQRPYETFSGGERARLNVALRLALARLLASRRGAEVELLAIDEIEHLDQAGFAGLVDVLQDAQTDFSRVLVVSHHPDLQLAFDQQIRIAKTDGVSTLSTETAREAVPA